MQNVEDGERASGREEDDRVGSHSTLFHFVVGRIEGLLGEEGVLEMSAPDGVVATGGGRFAAQAPNEVEDEVGIAEE